MRARGKKKLPPTKRAVPAYMTSFADMMTLMLTFFILLVAFAQEQRAELVAAGTGSFINALDSLGLPGLLPGGRRAIEMGAVSPNFAVPARHVSLAADGKPLNEDLLRPPPDRLRRSTIEYHLRREGAVALSTSVAFAPTTADLTPASRQALDRVAELAQRNLSYVGVEAHVPGPGDGWALSAQRAAAVARHLHTSGKISYRRIALAGYGRFRPVASAGRPGGDPRNERINVLLSSKPLD
jgi:chemotaxis protein MotB